MSTPLSLSLPVGYGIPPRELVRVIEKADQAGVAGVAVGELAATEALSLLAAAAPLTTSIRLETSVVSVLTRSPSLLAMAAATLADLSDGRFVLGLGAGSPIVAGYHGVRFTDLLSRVEGWVNDVRTSLQGGKLTDWGGFRLRGIEPVPVPILLAAMNPKMLALSGKIADGVILNFCGPEQVAELSGSALSARPGDAGPFEVHTTLWADASGDQEGARRRFRNEMAPYLAVPTYRSAVVALSSEEAIDRAAAAWKDGGREAAAAAFPDSIVDAMLATSVDELRDKAGRLGDAGCTGVRVTPLTRTDGERDHAEQVVAMLAAASC